MSLKPEKTKRNKNKPYHETTEDFTDLTKEMKNQIKNVVKGLDLKVRKFLLTVVWITKESKLMHVKCPWLLGCDENFWLVLAVDVNAVPVADADAVVVAGCLLVGGTLAGDVVVAVMAELSVVVWCESFGKKHKNGNRLD